MICESFRKKSAVERRRFIEDSSLCLNCLGRHKVGECISKRCCNACGDKHHTMMHDAFRAPAIAAADAPVESARSAHATRSDPEGRTAVLLATARVSVRDRHGNALLTRALIDQGSETSLISEALMQKLKLPRTRSSVAIFGVGGRQTGVARGSVTLRLASRNGGDELDVRAIILPRLTIYSGLSSEVSREWPHLRDLDLADPEFTAADRIDLLLGADVYAAILGRGVRKGTDADPVAQETSLGWIVSGAVDVVTSHAAYGLHQCSTEEPLSELVRRFWEQEELSCTIPTLTREEQEAEDFFARSVTRSTEGRYIVRLPTAGLPKLSETKDIATRVLHSMERRFARDADLRGKYLDFMREYESLGHMSLVPPGEDALRTCYLPHHGVMKGDGTGKRLRVVFNGSASLPSGDSLNRALLTGPNLLPPLADVLLKWRLHQYVFVADIEKMYRQILVDPLDRDLQRIVWRESPSVPLREYRLDTVTYGLSCAPFLAIRTLQQLAADEGDKLPLGAGALRNAYVDDVLAGAATRDEALVTISQLRELCTAGGFPLKKWASNCVELLKDVPSADLSRPGFRLWSAMESHPTLGIQWHPDTDDFGFCVKQPRAGVVTKRTVLSQSSQLFDPLGWLAPVVVRAKIFIQGAWLLGVDWDTPLGQDDEAFWRDFMADLTSLGQVRVPRWLRYPSDEVDIHGFSDASERAYSAVVYLRTRRSSEDGAWGISLVASKTRVAPLKQISLPRLELCAASLLVRLVDHIVSLLSLRDRTIHLWSDSTVVLGWVRGHPSQWKTFVANRVSEIQTTLPDAQWHHVSGVENPADCASRGVSPADLVNHTLWWHGPPWLSSWCGSSESPPSTAELPEARIRVHATAVKPTLEESEMLLRYSTLSKLLRVTSWCRRWLRLMTRGTDLAGDPMTISGEELEVSLAAWIRLVQADHFRAELRAIVRGEPVTGGSSLAKLTPFLDELGILRVGGRLKHSLLAYDEKHPVILPLHSRLTSLIILSCHSRVLHGGVQQTLGLLRQKYWVPGGRAAVKGQIHRCVKCVRWRAAAPQQLMGNLPGPRVMPVRPFANTGVDYAGPVWLRTSKGRGHRAIKAFLVIFVCFSTRAVHLDVVSDYTAESFLATLRCFVSRRGTPLCLYSDCGTNFAGAEAELRCLFSASNPESRRIGGALAEQRIQWKFNPPSAPHFGGLWEAAVKSTKHHLRRVLGDARLTYEEMATLLAEIEACLNSRPLSPLSDDPDDVAALTPGHFLVGSALLAVPEPSLEAVPYNRLSRWQQVQQMRDHFWQRWYREYLHGLTPRSKWLRVTTAPKVGQLCLLRSEVTPPTKWPLARILEMHPGEDGLTRVVTVKTASSSFTRPIIKIVLLPVEESAACNV